MKWPGGASSKYQDAVLELTGVTNTLRHLEAFQAIEDNIHYVTIIRAMALARQMSLQESIQESMTALEKYEHSLGPWDRETSSRSAGRFSSGAMI